MKNEMSKLEKGIQWAKIVLGICALLGMLRIIQLLAIIAGK